MCWQVPYPPRYLSPACSAVLAAGWCAECRKTLHLRMWGRAVWLTPAGVLALLLKAAEVLWSLQEEIADQPPQQLHFGKGDHQSLLTKSCHGGSLLLLADLPHTGPSSLAAGIQAEQTGPWRRPTPGRRAQVGSRSQVSLGSQSCRAGKGQGARLSLWAPSSRCAGCHHTHVHCSP